MLLAKLKSHVANFRSIYQTIAIIAIATCFTACEQSNGQSKSAPLLIISTDIATGLIDTEGAQSLLPVTFSDTSSYSRSSSVVPQDIDDGLTVAMALNLAEQGVVEVIGVVPTYGNASLAAEMLVAQQIVWTLKQRTDIPIIPGANGPGSQIIQPSSQWYDGTTLPIAGADGSFAAGCRNSGVDMMRRQIIQANRPVVLLAIGPFTDIACLLSVYPDTADRIAEIIMLASRIQDESLTINDIVVRDFNFSLDPIAGTILLALADQYNVPLRLMSFQLTGQTSQAGQLIEFNADTLRGPNPSTVDSERSLQWILEAIEPRNEFWQSIFGTPEGPFDQYTLVAAFSPQLFACADGLAYVQQCIYPAWSDSYPVDSNGQPIDQPYNSPDNACVDHGEEHGSALANTPAQLVVTFDLADNQPLVRGQTGIDGNIPAFDSTAVPVTVCTDFASQDAREQFTDLLYDNIW